MIMSPATLPSHEMGAFSSPPQTLLFARVTESKREKKLDVILILSHMTHSHHVRTIEA
jgi:hypothetical protein